MGVKLFPQLFSPPLHAPKTRGEDPIIRWPSLSPPQASIQGSFLSSLIPSFHVLKSSGFSEISVGNRFYQMLKLFELNFFIRKIIFYMVNLSKTILTACQFAWYPTPSWIPQVLLIQIELYYIDKQAGNENTRNISNASNFSQNYTTSKVELYSWLIFCEGMGA